MNVVIKFYSLSLFSDNIILNKKIIKMDIRILKQNMLKIEIVFIL